MSGIPAQDTPGNRGPAVGEKPDWLGEEVSKVSRYLNVELSRLPYTAWDQPLKEDGKK